MLFAISKVVKNTLCYISIFFDAIIYGLISTAYEVFRAISKVNLYNDSGGKIEALTSRIYIILGVAMLFVLAYNIIVLIVNPDSNKGDKSIQGILKNLVISIVILTLLPRAFEYMTTIQNHIINSNVIEKLILGSSAPTSGEYENMGENIATLIYSTFYYPIDSQGNPVSYEECEQNESLSASCKAYVEAYRRGKEKKVSLFIKDTTLEDALTSKTPTMDLMPMISSACGIVALLMFVSYAIDIGIRVAKLVFLQIIAPIPVILRVTKPSGGIFSQWLKKLSETYMTLFLRLLTIYFSVYMISFISDGFGSADGGVFASAGQMSTTVKLFARLILIIGVLLFAKEAPSLLEELAGNIGVKGGGFTPSDIAKKIAGVASAPVVGGAIGAIAGRSAGSLAGGAGAALSALRNNIRLAAGGKGAEGLTHMNVAAAAAQGSERGFKNGGGFKQFKQQGEKVFQETYNYGKKQGIFGGKSLGTKLDEKYGKIYENNVKQHAKDMNDQYIAEHVDPNLPKDRAGIAVTENNMNASNANFESTDAYTSVADFVKNEAREMGITSLSPQELKAKINQRLSQIASSTTDEKEKRAIESYLARESIMTNYENSILTGNQDAIAKVKADAEVETRRIVEAEIATKGLENVITDITVKTRLENAARTEVVNKISQAGGDITKVTFSEEAKKQISSNLEARVKNEIAKMGGVGNITLSQAAEAEIQTKLNDFISSNPNIQNSDIIQIEQNLRTQAVEQQVKISVAGEVIQDYMIKDEYKKQVSEELFSAKKDQVESHMMERAEAEAVESFASQVKDYEVGRITGKYSDDVSGKLDKEYNANFVHNETIHNDGVKSKSALDVAMDQIKEAVKEKTEEKKTTPKAENKDGKK